LKFQINDAVRLLVDLPDEGLARGTVGVVVADFSDPQEAYEVEFVNEEGETVAQMALLPSQLAAV
jgi:hypothetical protein